MVNAKEQTEYLMLLMVEKQLIKTKVKKLRLVGILRFGLSQPFLSIFSLLQHDPTCSLRKAFSQETVRVQEYPAL